MVKSIVRLVSVAAVAFALTPALQATSITGAMSFDGGVKLNTSSTATATDVSSWVSPALDLPSTGSFAGVKSGTAVKFDTSPWSFSTSSAISDFWSVGGFTFQLLSSTITSQGGTPGVSGFVVVSGTGLVSANGYAPTPMTWDFTGEDQQYGSKTGIYVFSVVVNCVPARPASVPDTASALGLLSLAFATTLLWRRKLA